MKKLDNKCPICEIPFAPSNYQGVCSGCKVNPKIKSPDDLRYCRESKRFYMGQAMGCFVGTVVGLIAIFFLHWVFTGAGTPGGMGFHPALFVDAICLVILFLYVQMGIDSFKKLAEMRTEIREHEETVFVLRLRGHN